MTASHLKDKVVVVTGAHTPLGQVMVAEFAKHQATTIGIYHSMEQAYKLFPDGIEGWVVADPLLDEEGVVDCFKKIEQQFHHVDILIHTLNEWGRKPIENNSFLFWDELIKSNLNSAFLCFRESIRLIGNRPGRLIALTSGQGADKGKAQYAAFAASNAGVIRLVESTAAEYARMEITAHAIATSIVLFEENGKHGVHANDIATLCVDLCGPSGRALNGATLRAYGTVQ